jgi:hypothetical protein
MLSEPLLVVARLARAFDELGIRYLVGGSLASALYGKPRATQDVDLVAEIASRMPASRHPKFPCRRAPRSPHPRRIDRRSGSGPSLRAPKWQRPGRDRMSALRGV